MARWFIGGYRRDIEDVAALEAAAIELPEFEGYKAAPPVETPWDQINQEHQASQGACFPAGTKVTMADGSLKNIEDIRFGDMVVSHTGKARRVIDTMCRSYPDEMVRIFVKGWGKLTMTEDHIVLVLRDGEEQWLPAGEVMLEDQLLISRGIQESSQNQIDLSNYVSLRGLCEDEGELSTSSSPGVPRYLQLDQNACFVLGLYAAEGSCDFQNGIPCRSTWSLHQDENDLAEQVVLFAERFGLVARVQNRTNTKAMQVRISSSVLADFLKNTCGRFSNRKEIPEFIRRGSPAQKLAFLQGYFAGDGTRKKYDSGRVAASGNVITCHQTEASTASKVLGQQVATLLVSLGFKPGRQLVRRRNQQRQTAYVNYLYSIDVPKLYGEEVTFAPGRARKVTESVSGQARKLREIERFPANGMEVYDFTVETDHSFIAEGVVVHNCQGHAISTIAEHCIRIATGDYTQLSRQYAYIETQRYDGLLGADRGSTIWGGVRLAKEKGICREDLWLYTGKYHTKPPQHSLEECYADAADRKVENHVKMTGYDSVLAFLEQGLGGISIGMRWNSFCEAKVCERYQTRRGGGHAISLLFKSPRLDRAGRNYIWMNNSWGANWGNRGWSEWAPDFINDVFDDTSYTVAYGITDMANPEPRPINYIGRLG